MPSHTSPAPLRAEINQLGKQLGDTVEMLSGAGAFEAVERIRALSGERRAGDSTAEDELRKTITDLDDETLRVVIRAYTVFLDLANLAEDRQRLRVLSERASQKEATSKSESIRGAILRLREEGTTAEELQKLIDGLSIELVFTAHPTEAKRRSVRSKLRSIRNALPSLADVSEEALAKCDVEVRCEMAKLWMTDFIRPWRPTVLQEVRRGLSVKSVLWEVIPDIMQEIRQAVSDAYPNDTFQITPCIRYGSWIGGDRDGHPYVTTAVTAQTLNWLHDAAIEFHDSSSRQLFQSLSLSSRQTAIPDALLSAVGSAVKEYPEIEAALTEIPPSEIYRRWLAVIRWRLLRSKSERIATGEAVGCYGSSEELESDVLLLQESFSSDTVGQLLRAEVQRWLDQVRCFGLYMAQLDVRQDSQNYSVALNEVLTQAGLSQTPADLNEEQRQELLVSTMLTPAKLDRSKLSDETVEVLDLFDLLVSTRRSFGAEALGSHVISMTRTASDVLTVLWLWQHAWSEQTSDWENSAPALSIAPLFETVSDLQNAPDIMRQLLRQPAYRDHLSRQSDRQIVMLGYSDSTKDGGYLSACWSLFQAQVRINDIAVETVSKSSSSTVAADRLDAAAGLRHAAFCRCRQERSWCVAPDRTRRSARTAL